MTPFEYLSEHAEYIDHSPEISAKDGKFWPHNCLTLDYGKPCVFYIKDDLGTEVCELDCFRYRDLPLADYVAMRMKEEGQGEAEFVQTFAFLDGKAAGNNVRLNNSGFQHPTCKYTDHGEILEWHKGFIVGLTQSINHQSPCQCATDCQECFTGECGR